MLTNSKDFTIRLKKIKAEVLAFKQYKKIGVGRADFPNEIVSVRIDNQGSFNVKLTVEFENALVMPYMQFLVKYTWEPLPGGNFQYQNNIYTNEYTGTNYEDDYDYELQVIATAPIKAISLEKI